VLIGISIVVIFTTLIGMTAIIFSSLNERRREMAIWRAMGATPNVILGLLMLEAFIVSFLSSVISTIFLFLLLIILQPWIDQTYGILISIEMFSVEELSVFVYFILAALLISLLPALRAYWLSINDGMTIKI
jgi:putative ABC transport system permease protein